MANDELPNLAVRLGRSALLLGSSKNFRFCWDSYKFTL